MRRTWLALPMAALMTLGAAAFFIPACATDANDVTGCRTLEFERCTRATSCGIDLQGLLPTGSSEADAVTACQLFYQDACLHGLATTATVEPSQITGCLNAITNGDCNVVVNPQSSPACAFLIPPDAGTDATDAIVDASTPDTTIIIVVEDSGAEDAGSDAEGCLGPCDSTCIGDPNCIQNCETTCAGM